MGLREFILQPLPAAGSVHYKGFISAELGSQITDQIIGSASGVVLGMVKQQSAQVKEILPD